MADDFLTKFMCAKFERRQKTVRLPELKEFFPKDQHPDFIVQGLTGPELAKTLEAPRKYKDVAGLIDGILSDVSKDKIDAIKESLGITGKVPDEIAKRLEQLVLGSVEPKFTQDAAVKFCEKFPIEFWILTNSIAELTGRGHEPGKSKPSGTTTKSEQH